ncbi:MAG TPA: YraN family protein [Thermoanaerobaculia bacterium]|nr:YraN family protein [Thermoanaerobaculia bacterium]
MGSRPRSNRARGRAAEEAGVRWLESQGYQVVERNVRTRAGEIDLVARDGATLCFVEIKARGSDAFGTAAAAVGAVKQRRLCRAAALYLARRGLHLTPSRFDVLALDRRDGAWIYTLIRDAFPFGY